MRGRVCRLTAGGGRLREKLADLGAARGGKILLAQMTDRRADGARDGEMIVDDQADARAARHRENALGHPLHLGRRRLLGAELDQVRAAIAELPRDVLRCAPVQERGVHKGVEPAMKQWSVHSIMLFISRSPVLPVEQMRQVRRGAHP